MKELKSMLENVKGSYDFFVVSVLSKAEENNNLEKIKNYINSNPNASSSDVNRFIDDNCEVTYNDDEIPEWAQEDEDDEE